MDSYEVLPNGQVLRCFKTGSNDVKEHFDMFYHVLIETNKTDILANDIDTATVTASVFNYLNVAVDYTGDIDFDVEGELFYLPAVNGRVTLEITSDFANQIDIAAWINNSRAGGCIIYAKDSLAKRA